MLETCKDTQKHTKMHNEIFVTGLLVGLVIASCWPWVTQAFNIATFLLPQPV